MYNSENVKSRNYIRRTKTSTQPGCTFPDLDLPHCLPLGIGLLDSRILDRIVFYLADSHLSLSRFASTSKYAFEAVRQRIIHYDVSRANYCGDEVVKQPVPYVLPHLRMSSQPKNIATFIAGHGNHYIVSRHHELKKTRYTLKSQNESVYRLACALHNVSEDIVKLDFHRVDFLTLPILECHLGTLCHHDL